MEENIKEARQNLKVQDFTKELATLLLSGSSNRQYWEFTKDI